MVTLNHKQLIGTMLGALVMVGIIVTGLINANYIPQTEKEIFEWCKQERLFFNSSVYCGGSNKCRITQRSLELGKIVQDYCFGKFWNQADWVISDEDFIN